VKIGKGSMPQMVVVKAKRCNFYLGNNLQVQINIIDIFKIFCCRGIIATAIEKLYYHEKGGLHALSTLWTGPAKHYDHNVIQHSKVIRELSKS
jgi:hypothetical protein